MEHDAEEGAEGLAEGLEHSADAVETAAQGAEAAGMPQLEFSTFPNQIFWLIVTLIAIYFVITRFAIPRISAVLAERQGSITNDIAAADELKEKAAEAEAAYDKALADARSEANSIADRTRADIQEGLDAQLAKADAEIAARTAESEKAISAIQAEAEQNVAAVAKDVAKELVTMLDTGADPSAVDQAVNAHMGGGS